MRARRRPSWRPPARCRCVPCWSSGALAFTVVLAGLMAVAFRERPAEPQASSAAAEPSPRTPLDTPRNRLIRAWHARYEDGEEAVARQDLAEPEAHFAAALHVAEQFGSRDAEALEATRSYLAWVRERRRQLAER